MTKMNLTTKTRRALNKYGMEACRICWTENRMNGEGPTMCAMRSGLHFNSVSAAISAYEEYRKSSETIMHDFRKMIYA